MKALDPHLDTGPPPRSALEPGLQSLIDRGLLARGQAEEVMAFAREVHEAISRGEMTLLQADTLGQMLGVRYARGRRILQ